MNNQSARMIKKYLFSVTPYSITLLPIARINKMMSGNNARKNRFANVRIHVCSASSRKGHTSNKANIPSVEKPIIRYETNPRGHTSVNKIFAS